MSIYDVDFSQAEEQLTPPDKREPKFLAWLKALIYPVQWLRDVFFNEYVMGSSAADYVSSNTYLKGERVRYVDKAVYEALQDVPINDTPGNPLLWYKINENFIGIDQRVKLTSQIMSLQGDLYPAVVPYGRANEKGSLNKWFGVTSAPWIYIINNDFESDLFFFGRTEGTGFSKTDNSNFVEGGFGLTYTGPDDNYDFTIMFPIAIYTSLASTDDQRNAIIRNFVDNYVIAGILYDIQTY